MENSMPKEIPGASPESNSRDVSLVVNAEADSPEVWEAMGMLPTAAELHHYKVPYSARGILGVNEITALEQSSTRGERTFAFAGKTPDKDQASINGLLHELGKDKPTIPGRPRINVSKDLPDIIARADRDWGNRVKALRHEASGPVMRVIVGAEKLRRLNDDPLLTQTADILEKRALTTVNQKWEQTLDKFKQDWQGVTSSSGGGEPLGKGALVGTAMAGAAAPFIIGGLEAAPAQVIEAPAMEEIGFKQEDRQLMDQELFASSRVKRSTQAGIEGVGYASDQEAIADLIKATTDQEQIKAQLSKNNQLEERVKALNAQIQSLAELGVSQQEFEAQIKESIDDLANAIGENPEALVGALGALSLVGLAYPKTRRFTAAAITIAALAACNGSTVTPEVSPSQPAVEVTEAVELPEISPTPQVYDGSPARVEELRAVAGVPAGFGGEASDITPVFNSLDIQNNLNDQGYAPVVSSLGRLGSIIQDSNGGRTCVFNNTETIFNPDLADQTEQSVGIENGVLFYADNPDSNPLTKVATAVDMNSFPENWACVQAVASPNNPDGLAAGTLRLLVIDAEGNIRASMPGAFAGSDDVELRWQDGGPKVFVNGEEMEFEEVALAVEPTSEQDRPETTGVALYGADLDKITPEMRAPFNVELQPLFDPQGNPIEPGVIGVWRNQSGEGEHLMVAAYIKDVFEIESSTLGVYVRIPYAGGNRDLVFEQSDYEASIQNGYVLPNGVIDIQSALSGPFPFDEYDRADTEIRAPSFLFSEVADLFRNNIDQLRGRMIIFGIYINPTDQLTYDDQINQITTEIGSGTPPQDIGLDFPLGPSFWVFPEDIWRLIP